jgi:hypothetical protein
MKVVIKGKSEKKENGLGLIPIKINITYFKRGNKTFRFEKFIKINGAKKRK